MSDDVFSSSPWTDETSSDSLPAESEAVSEKPKTPKKKAEPPAPGQEGVTLSFKGGDGYDASLLVLRAPTIAAMEEMLETESNELAALMQRMAKIQAYSNELNGRGQARSRGKSSFVGGKVQAAPDAEHKGVTTCQHGRTYVAKNGWEAYFCNAEGAKKCQASFYNSKTGVFELARG